MKHPEGVALWVWHNMFEELGYAINGPGSNEISASTAEHPASNRYWDYIVLGGQFWIR